MKVVLLAGGLGSRLAEETTRIPKPMVEVGGKPIILHVMDIYSHWGFHDFVVAGGYKCMMIKAFFQSFHLTTADFTVDLGSGAMVLRPTRPLDWNVSVVDTGWHPPAVKWAPWLRGVGGDPETIDPKDIHRYAGHGTFIAGVVRAIDTVPALFLAFQKVSAKLLGLPPPPLALGRLALPPLAGPAFPCFVAHEGRPEALESARGISRNRSRAQGPGRPGATASDALRHPGPYGIRRHSFIRAPP